MYVAQIQGFALLIISNCFNTNPFASIKRSTQFCMHGSSYLSNFPEVIFEVMHLRKQRSVRVWIASLSS